MGTDMSWYEQWVVGLTSNLQEKLDQVDGGGRGGKE